MSTAAAVRKAFPDSPSTARARPPRVALVVDHPLRDLPSMTLTAARLCDAGVECFLTPANLGHLELWRLAPDFVLLNFLRRITHSMRLYRGLMEAGVALGVLDTEGGVVESLDAFARDLATDARIRQGVSCYLTWGPRLGEHLVSEGLFRSDQVQVTGCPRTDFYADPWRRSAAVRSSEAAEYDSNLVLINTNFSLGNPAMLSREGQFRLMTESLGHPAERIHQWQDNEVAGMRGLAQVANTIAAAYPQATVVLRPHPFERLETYHELLDRRDNLHCVREGTIEGWLLRAKVVIQRSCSTSIEASMVGAPALAPNWLPTAFERPAANETSVPCPSLEALVSQVGEILAGRFTLPLEVARRTSQVVHDWFGQVDGRAHERVADAILNHLPAGGRRRRVRRCRSFVYTKGRRFPNGRWFAGKLRSALGKSPEYSFRLRRSKETKSDGIVKWENSPKHFNEQDVLAVCRSLATTQETGGYQPSVTAADSDNDYVCSYPFSRSIRMTRTAT